MSRISRGELARRSGVNIETILYFEKIGTVAAPPRSQGGHRVYDESHVRLFSFIRSARELGFAPGEIRALLNLGAPSNAGCAEVRELASQHLARVRQKMVDLARLEVLLASTIDRCSGGAAPECAVIDLLVQPVERPAGQSA